jgi:AcrR family transcriptional regulator
MPPITERTTPGTKNAVRPRGRPSIAATRRVEIIEAYIQCIRTLGLDGATVDQIAKTLGVSRTLIFHYFGDTQNLTRALTEYIVANAIRDMTTRSLGLAPDARRKALLDFMFDGAHFRSLRDVVVVSELIALAGRDEIVATMLSRMWEAEIEAVTSELANAFPDASATDHAGVAYGLMCIGELHWWLTFIGPAAKRSQAARRAAEILVDALEKQSDHHGSGE